MSSLVSVPQVIPQLRGPICRIPPPEHEVGAADVSAGAWHEAKRERFRHKFAINHIRNRKRSAKSSQMWIEAINSFGAEPTIGLHTTALSFAAHCEVTGGFA